MQIGVHYNSVTKHEVTVCTPRKPFLANLKKTVKSGKLKLKKKKGNLFGIASWEEEQRDVVKYFSTLLHFQGPDMRLKFT